MENEALRLSANISRLSEKSLELHVDLSRTAELLDSAKEIDIICNDIQALSGGLESLAEAIESNANISQRSYSLAKQLFNLSQSLVDQAEDISKHLSPASQEHSTNFEKWICASKWTFYKSAYRCLGIYLASFKQALNLLATALTLHQFNGERRHARTLSALREQRIAVDRETLQLRNYLVDPGSINPFIQHHYLAVVPRQRQSFHRAALDSGPMILDVANNLFPGDVLSMEDKTALRRFQEQVEQTSRERGLDATSGVLYFENSFALHSALESTSNFVNDVIEEDQRSRSPSVTSHPSPNSAARRPTSTTSQLSVTLDSPSDELAPPPYTEHDDRASIHSGSTELSLPTPSSIQFGSSVTTHDGSTSDDLAVAASAQNANSPRSSPAYYLFPPTNESTPTNRVITVHEQSTQGGGLRVTPSYSTLNSTTDTTSDAASNRFSSTDTLIPRNTPRQVEGRCIPSNLPEVAISDLPEAVGPMDERLPEVDQTRHADRPRRSSELLPSGMRDQVQISLSNAEWLEFINNSTSLGERYKGPIIEFQDAMGTLHPLPLEQCKSFNNLVSAIHSRLRVRITNPDALVRINKAFAAPLSDVIFYKLPYAQLPRKGDVDFRFCITPVRWPVEARPDMRVCVQFTSARLDNHYGLARWRDLHSADAVMTPASPTAPAAAGRKNSLLQKVLSKRK